MISERNRYILKMLCFLAEQGDDSYRKMSDLTDTLDIPRGYLNQIIPDLVDLGYIESKRGKGGGVRLAREPEDMPVRDALEDIGVLDHPGADQEEACCIPVGFDECMVEIWLDRFKNNVIGNITFKDLCESLNDERMPSG